MDLASYFQSYRDYFWEWGTDDDIPDENGYNENNFLFIPNVGTISYRAYLIEILKELLDQGFPPFGSFLLVLYAAQERDLNLDSILRIVNTPENKLPRKISDEIIKASKFLRNINQLNPSLRKAQNKIILLKTIFKDCHSQLSAGNSKLIIKIFERNPKTLSDAANQFKINLSVIEKDFKTLALLHDRFPTTELLVEAMKNFGDILVLEDEIVEEETTVETDKDFIRELIEEPKTFQVGSLIKRIWSGLKIPMRHLSPGEQPIGGVSDMSNKGDFHRMLLSEFANDDEVFMNRVANNEALYIQREIPPEENVFERIILIDTSLKNWGTPKVLAYASAIAVIKHPKAHSECKVFALGQHSVPISLNKITEVIDNLNQVSPVLEVSDALQKFFEEKHTGNDLEVFFITNEENLAHPKLQKVIHENRNQLKFLVTTSAEGELNFYKHHKGTKKHIQKILLPLKELWAHPPKSKQQQNKNHGIEGVKADFPLNYPLLFPMPQNKIASFLLEGEFFILSAKKQLLRTYLSDNYYNKNYYDQYRTHRGCEVLFENISVKPRGQFALAKNRQQQYILCQYQPDKKLISKLNLNTEEYSETNVSLIASLSDFRLTYFNKKFYLWSENADWIQEINIDGNTFLENVKNNREIKRNNDKASSERQRLFTYHDDKILSNYNKIAITETFGLVINKYELTVHENVMRLNRTSDELLESAQKIKNKFVFSEGSEIIADSRGVLTFKSANTFVPVFYLVTTTDGFLAIASDTEFGGSEFYLPESTLLNIKTIAYMYSEYLQPFIHQITDYGTEN